MRPLGGHHRRLGLGRDHPSTSIDSSPRSAKRGSQLRQGGGGRRVARDPPAAWRTRDQLVGDLLGESEQLVPVIARRREASGVSQVQEVLVRKRDEKLVQDG
jgi:hypothetical protein